MKKLFFAVALVLVAVCTMSASTEDVSSAQRLTASVGVQGPQPPTW